MTIAERRNAATFIHYTTVRPFKFIGYSFKCFFCQEYNLELPLLMKHTLDHDVSNLSEIFQKYVHKGKRILKADISELKCRLCGEGYQNLDRIREHLTSEHKIKFLRASNGIIEYNMATKNHMFVCHICKEDFHNFSLLSTHMNSHFGKVVCDACGESFLNRPLLNKHKETHQSRKFDCKFCEKTFVKSSQLQYHTDTVHQHKYRLSKCPFCPEQFKEHYSKMLHIRDVHGVVKTFNCHLCKMAFGKRRLLTQHVTKCHTERFKCNICSKCFGTEAHLKMHMPSHTGEKNFLCNICKNAYAYRNALKRHMMMTHRERNLVCSENKN
ncbi:hypothetical protein K1T71_014622 [Dendrolimus kikuchii]|uniref:Uncharacterized protein n=1 Tax=Dendrolimus kikuchii TaxID=765133 RepID=A0ACC1CEW2_9NEOP|nr:hypothetical protein K1T71_014622 [Dendrolimus kikuchii]